MPSRSPGPKSHPAESDNAAIYERPHVHNYYAHCGGDGSEVVYRVVPRIALQVAHGEQEQHA